MTRVKLQFGLTSSKYRKFGTDTLSKQTDADLLITGKRVVRVAKMFLSELAKKGLTQTMLDTITGICNDF
jgi:hypothetical protein